MTAPRRAIFLDRDGVLNRVTARNGKPYPPQTVADLEILPGVVESTQRLRAAGFLLVGVTNQPDVVRGTQSRDVVEAINARLREQVVLDDLLTCYEDGPDAPRRKPNPGMLLEAAAAWGIDLTGSFLVGDRWSDVEAGRRAGTRTVFLDYGYAERRPDPPADLTTSSLLAATDWILQQPYSTRGATAMKSLKDLKIKIFADGADMAGMVEMAANPLIKGFTTNPTLMRKAGISNYEGFAKEILQKIRDKPISFEVFSDDLPEMNRQARKIATWGDNVYVKIPVTNTRGESTAPLVKELAHAGMKLNVTAVFTLKQVWEITCALKGGAPAVVSVFAGRIADAGVDPVPHMQAAVEMVRTAPGVELLWASPREILNIIQADQVGCDIITCTNDILKKAKTIGMELSAFSLDTVKMFYDDGKAAGFQL